MNIDLGSAFTEAINMLVPIGAITIGICLGAWLLNAMVRIMQDGFDEGVHDALHRIVARPISEMPADDLTNVHYSINAKTPPEAKPEKDRCAYCGGKTRPNWTNCRNCGAPL